MNEEDERPLPTIEEVRSIVRQKLNEGKHAEAAELMVLYPIIRMGADKFAEGLIQSVQSYLELREILAAISHDAWTHWSKQLFAEEKSLSSRRYQRWRRYWVPYEKLPEAAKKDDRDWASKMVLAVIKWKAQRDKELIQNVAENST